MLRASTAPKVCIECFLLLSINVFSLTVGTMLRASSAPKVCIECVLLLSINVFCHLLLVTMLRAYRMCSLDYY